MTERSYLNELGRVKVAGALATIAGSEAACPMLQLKQEDDGKEERKWKQGRRGFVRVRTLWIVMRGQWSSHTDKDVYGFRIEGVMN